MPNNLMHFAIHADSVERARSFLRKGFWLAVYCLGTAGFFLDQDWYGRRSRSPGSVARSTGGGSG